MSFFKKGHLLILLANLAAAAVLLFVIGYIVLNRLDKYTRHGFSIEVPDLRGMTLAEARPLVEKAQLNIDVIDSVYSPNARPGAIMDQFPTPQARVKNNRIIQLTTNAVAPEKVTFPDLRNSAFRQALQRLAVLGLKPGRLEFAPSSFRNLVLDFKLDNQIIEPGTEIEKGKTVDIVLGAGTPGNDQVYLPELLGKTLQDARSQILLAYLNLGQVLPDESVKTTEDLEKAVVYAQKPEYIDKLTVPQGSFVTLHVTLDEQKIATVDSLLTLPKK